jgi:hypothetical protein
MFRENDRYIVIVGGIAANATKQPVTTYIFGDKRVIEWSGNCHVIPDPTIQ